MVSFSSFIALFAATAGAVCATTHTSMTLTYFKSNTNCTQPSTKAKVTVEMYKCLGTAEYKDGTDSQVWEYMYEGYGTCTVPCTDPNNLNCQWGLYLPYYLNVCNSGICSKDQYGVLTCGDAFIPVAV